MDVRVELWRRLSAEELMLLNCGVGEDSWESLELQGDPTSPFWRNQPWDFFGRNDAKAETPVLWPSHAKSWLIGKEWCWEGLGARGEGDDRGWDGWMASLSRWTEWTPGVADGQGGLACCDSWGHKESDTTELLIWSDLIYKKVAKKVDLIWFHLKKGNGNYVMWWSC